MGAFALQALGQRDEAEKWMLTSLKNSPRDSITTYNAACFYALAGNEEKSLNYLEQSANARCLNLDWLDKDSDLDSVRDNPRFKEIIANFKETALDLVANR
jgi:adenylate cyclase